MEVLTPPVKSTRASQRPLTVPPLVWILAAGAVIRCALWLYWADLPVRIVDAQDYNGLAVRLVQTGHYISDSGQPISLRPPLYPAFLAVVYGAAGLESFPAVRAVQSLLGLVIAAIVYRLGSELYGKQIGQWAAAVACFYPSLVGFQFLLLSETLFTLLVCAAVLMLVLAYRRKRMAWLAVAAFLLGLGTLTRSILWPMTLLMTLYVAASWPGRFASRLSAAGLLLGVFAATIAPWSYRNTRLQQTFTLVDVMGGRNAMMGNYEYTPLERSWATIGIATGDKAWYHVLYEKHPELRGTLTQGQLDKLAKQHAKQFILSHPWLTLKRDVVKFFNYWQLERTLVAGAVDGIFGPLPRWLIAVAGLLIWGTYAAVLFSGIFGMLMTLPAERRLHWLMVGVVLIPSLLHALVFGHSRYHLPFMPIVTIYSAAAIVGWSQVWQQRRGMLFRIAVSMCMILIAAWMREIVMVDLGRMAG